MKYSANLWGHSAIISRWWKLWIPLLPKLFFVWRIAFSWKPVKHKIEVYSHAPVFDHALPNHPVCIMTRCFPRRRAHLERGSWWSLVMVCLWGAQHAIRITSTPSSSDLRASALDCISLQTTILLSGKDFHFQQWFGFGCIYLQRTQIWSASYSISGISRHKKSDTKRFAFDPNRYVSLKNGNPIQT